MSILQLFRRRCDHCGLPREAAHLCPEDQSTLSTHARVDQVCSGILSVGEHGYFLSPAKVIELAREHGGDVDAVEALMRVAVQYAMDREGVPALPIVLTDVVREGSVAA